VWVLLRDDRSNSVSSEHAYVGGSIVTFSCFADCIARSAAIVSYSSTDDDVERVGLGSNVLSDDDNVAISPRCNQTSFLYPLR
jgi:hypothetical protein